MSASASKPDTARQYQVVSFRDYYLKSELASDIESIRQDLSEGVLIQNIGTDLLPHPDKVLPVDIQLRDVTFWRGSETRVYTNLFYDVLFKIQGFRDGQYLTDWVSRQYWSCSYSDLSPTKFILGIPFFLTLRNAPIVPLGPELDEYLIPIIDPSLLDEEAEDLIVRYCPEALQKPQALRGQTLARRMGLKVKCLQLAQGEQIQAQMVFQDRVLQVISPKKGLASILVPADTIVVDISGCMDEDGVLNPKKVNDAIIHECIHAHRHRLFYLAQSRFQKDFPCPACSEASRLSGDAIDMSYTLARSIDVDEADRGCRYLAARSPIDQIEWEATRLTPRVQMPASTTMQKIEALYGESRERFPLMGPAKRTAWVVRRLSEFFYVSKQAAKLRMVELGYPEAMGVLNYVNGCYVPDHSFAPGSLGKGQTFTIGSKEAAALYQKDAAFRKELATGRYLYLDGHYCLNLPRYIYRRKGVSHLTGYALAHMNECCIIFSMRSTKFPHTYTAGVMNKLGVHLEQNAQYIGSPIEYDYFAEAQRISDILFSLPASPSGTLIRHMERRGLDISGLVSKSGVSERTIKRLRTNPAYATNKNNIMAISVGLQLEPALRRDWFKKCGLFFTASPKDQLYEMMLDTMYNLPLSAFNRKLVEYNLPPLSNGVDQLDQ